MFFKSLREAHKLGAMATKWAGFTRLDPGDRGQITKLAMNYMAEQDMAPEDAWLYSLTQWMNGMPWPEDQLTIARELTRFMDAYEGKIALSAATIVGARMAAKYITDGALADAEQPWPGF